MLVYLAGPITKGNPSINVQWAVLAADKIMFAGHAVFVPQLSVLWEMISPIHRTYEDWMRLDLEILLRCDVLVRIPGESKGADEEVRFALQHGKPVFYGVEEFLG